VTQPRCSLLVARCIKQAASQCDILSQALPGLYSCRLCACSTWYSRRLCAGSRGLHPPLAAARLWLLEASDRYRVAMKIQCCINVTRALRGIGAARLRSCSPHVRALHPRPYSRGILIALPFVLYIVVRTRG
jgi:hypothetical protein